MNKVKILAVAMVSLASTAFAAGDLWDFATLLSTSNPNNCGKYCGQVHTPGAIFCWNQTDQTSENGYGRPCFDGTGGFWFGYADEGGSVKDANSNNNIFVPKGTVNCETNLSPTEAVGTVVVEKYINDGTNKENTVWKDHVIGPVTTVAAGAHYMVKGYGMGDGTAGFDVIFSNPGGTDEKPNVSAIGFNWRGKEECNRTDFEGSYVQDLTAEGKTGLCLVYKADKAGVDVELGWNEKLYEYNTWIMKLPATDGAWKTVNMSWTSFGLSYETDEPTEPRETALTKAEALKFALKTRSATAETIRFGLKEVGWHGSCSGTAEELPPYTGGGGMGNPNPIIGGKIASAHKFSINGRTLSANFAGTVQVINLQGKVVAKKTLAANESLSLANLPAGIYMVRSENRGIVQKVILK
ncbi:MAG: T9SS type A sorting domain-containing protein [Fibromonadaceae bacterium]|jgi:hypothetical protein|nr:T9SS type A sorting domain-containing protein [Fibromonadaceae bacterium]